MQFPNKVTIGSHDVEIRVVDHVLEHSTGPKWGMFEPMLNRATIYNDKDNATIGEETFIHELIEFVDGKYDLQLPHQTITTLAVCLRQAFTSGSVCFTNECIQQTPTQ